MPRRRLVIFVCEHGSAKSVVAAAHFNRLAARRGLDLHAVARGTNPDKEIAPAAVAGLAAEGIQITEKPKRLSKHELIAGLYVSKINRVAKCPRSKRKL